MLIPEFHALVDASYLASTIFTLRSGHEGENAEVLLKVRMERERNEREADRLIYNTKWISQGGGNDSLGLD